MKVLIKGEVRPLLVKALQAALEAEELAYRATRNSLPTWEATSKAKEAWDKARLTRAQAELHLWLADRQWEREEAEANQQAPNNASPTGKI